MVNPFKLIKRTLHNLSLIDVSVLIFLCYFNLRLLYAPDSQDARIARSVFQGTFIFYCVTLLLSRGEAMQSERVRGVIHRSSLLLSVLGLYIAAMRRTLAALQPKLVDLQLADLDRALFGQVPAQALEQWSHPALTEWLAFFYYSYFIIVALAALPTAFWGRSALPRALASGIVFIVCIGHVIYTFVPGRGPYVALEFNQPLIGGLFWGVVQDVVAAQGALLDIFPSLHTALPSFITLHIIRQRQRWSLRLSWKVVCTLLLFFTLNIILATLYLRWHYAVDVIGGLILAVVTHMIVTRVNPDDDQRAARGKQPIFELCFGVKEISDQV